LPSLDPDADIATLPATHDFPHSEATLISKETISSSLSNAPWNRAVGRVFFALDPLYQPLFEESPSSSSSSSGDDNEPSLSQILLDTFQNFSDIPVGRQPETGRRQAEEAMEDAELGWVVDDVGVDMNQREDGTGRDVIETILRDVGIKFEAVGEIVGEDREEEDGKPNRWDTKPERYATPSLIRSVSTPCADQHSLLSLLRLCFNCSSSSHSLQDCPTPHIRSVISANRKAYQALLAASREEERPEGALYHSDDFLMLRLEMLDRHEPGEFSEGLKEALEDGRTDGELGSWIWEGMARWGYPPGWYSVEGELLG
jgi:hypothetical protein